MIAGPVGKCYAARRNTRQNNERNFPVLYLHLGSPRATLKQIRRATGTVARRFVCLRVPLLLVRQGKYRQGSAERGVLRETGIAADRTKACRVDRLVLGGQLALVDRAMPGRGVFRLQQTGRQANARPAADARK